MIMCRQLLILLSLIVADSTRSFAPIVSRRRQSTCLFSTSEASFTAVSTLINELKKDDAKNPSVVANCIRNLEDIGSSGTTATRDEYSDDEDPTRFDALVGLYYVSHVQTKNPRENPVGGKWTRKRGLAQKLLRTRQTYQHILGVNETGIGLLNTVAGPVVGEAVNVISLEALFGWIRTTIILRGDAVAIVNATERADTTLYSQSLSARSVRALFDAPRIVVGRLLNLNVGPSSSVVLDTTYVDDEIRIGMGGRSGSRFVFVRCHKEDDEAREFREMLQKKPLSKRKLLASLSVCMASGVATALRGRQLTGILTALLSGTMGAIIAFSGGGIERSDASVAESRRVYADSTSSTTK